VRQALVLLLIASFTWAAEPAAVKRTYKISNVSGPVAGREGDFRLRLHGDVLTIENKRTKRNLDIAGAQITHVLYTPMRFSRVDQVPAPSGGCYGEGCGGVVILYLAAALIVSPMHGHSHFVRITWTDRNVEQQVQFEIGKDDYQPLLESLRAFSGVKYMDLETVAHRVRGELEKNAGKALPLKLEHASRLGDYDLDSGEYRMVALDRGDHQADIYVFPAAKTQKIQPENLKAAVHATVVDAQSADGVEYVAGTARISAICTAGQLYQFMTPVP
jgi:hypothetical protein